LQADREAQVRRVKTVLAEIFGLFVDDGNFALAIIVWLGIVGVVLPRFSIPPVWGGIILFIGLAAILSESALRRARRKSA
jgi:hypothetical protein